MVREWREIGALAAAVHKLARDRDLAAARRDLADIMREVMHYPEDRAASYAQLVIASGGEMSGQTILDNGYRLLGRWQRSDNSGSAGNLVVSRTERWTFTEDLRWERRFDSYEGYSSPFGGGYSRPRSSTSTGSWAPSDVARDEQWIVLIDDAGVCRRQTVRFDGTAGLYIEGVRFAR